MDRMNLLTGMGGTEEAFQNVGMLELGRDPPVHLTEESCLYLVEAVTKGLVTFIGLVYWSGHFKPSLDRWVSALPQPQVPIWGKHNRKPRGWAWKASA